MLEEEEEEERNIRFEIFEIVEGLKLYDSFCEAEGIIIMAWSLGRDEKLTLGSFIFFSIIFKF